MTHTRRRFLATSAAAAGAAALTPGQALSADGSEAGSRVGTAPHRSTA
ncbi:MAG: twin-arginine translocation signal domain-containing protein, partial [Gemmatimonadetes bacterium]|nr:twin-arginine translocation signal domain-containing protein [Gemmatimonadota bacterium]MYJ12284.1 twin-arginine translocation signal domain-containing protein [Gemmatimonadota bacterium]